METKEKHHKFIEKFIAETKSAYLEGKDMIPHFFLFEDDHVWMLPFKTRDNEHKNLLLKSLAAMIRIKGIKRYAYVIDSWTARVDLKAAGYDEEKMTKEEVDAAVRKIRDHEMPASLEHYSKRVEALYWSIQSIEGTCEKSGMHEHDSAKHEFIGEAEERGPQPCKGIGSFTELFILAEAAKIENFPLPTDVTFGIMLHLFSPAERLKL